MLAPHGNPRPSLAGILLSWKTYSIRSVSGSFGFTNHKNPFFCSRVIKTQPNTNIADDRELSIISIDVSKINPKNAL